MLLRLAGQEVEVTYSGAAAIEAVRTNTPDMMFLDLGMPEMDGFEVARTVRSDAERRAVVLVALTGWGQEEDRRRTKEAGFDYHLVKPVDAAQLQEILATPNPIGDAIETPS